MPAVAVITSADNPAVKSARKLVRRRERARRRLLLVEGPHAVAEARPYLRRLFVSADAARRHADLVADATRDGAEVLAVTDGVLASLADAATPQGLIGVAEQPTVDLTGALDAVAGGGLAVVLAGVADPGNAGTVLRTADAGGADAVVVTAGSVDVGNPKAVRASAGSLFHLPVAVDADPAAVLAECRRRAIATVAADAGATLPHTAVDLTRPTALAFGNEAHGHDPGFAAACDALVRVPMRAGPRPGFRGSPESLNLAATAAVVVFEAARQRAGTRRP